MTITCSQLLPNPEGSCPPTVDMLPLRGYTHEMKPTRSSLTGMESYNQARCVCQLEVKGHSSTNDHDWQSTLNEVSDVQLVASNNSSSPLICFCCVSFIIHAFCPLS